MNIPKFRVTSRLVLGGVLASLLHFSAQGTPYATGLTNTGSSISFRLNESADSVRIIFNGGASIADLGARTAGVISTNLVVAGDYQVEVSKSSAPGYIDGAALQISSDSNPAVRFPNPRGVAVNTNPADPNFGRIYVANGAAGNVAISGRTNVTDGIFVLNPDFTDTFGQASNALTGGISFAVTGDTAGNSPWRLEVGADGNLYISDFSTNAANIYVTDANVSNGTNVLAGFGIPDGNHPLSSPNHGRSPSSVFATGSLGTGDLTLYGLEGDVGFINRLRRWDVNGGPLPVDIESVVVGGPALLEIAGVTVDLDRGPDGKFYLLQNRSAGGEAGLEVMDPTYDADFDGLWDIVYSSFGDSTHNLGNTNDFLAMSRAVKVSPDGKYVAVLRDTSDTWIVPLVDGIPNLAGRRLVPTGSTGTGRDVSFDAAGNLYVSTSGHSALRVFSPGYKSVATTGSAGTFNVEQILPDNQVSVAASNANAAEPNTAGTFTFTRTGSTDAAITVNYTISGSATRGVDWVTNGISSTTSASITLGVGEASKDVSITPIDDSANEPNETVIFTLVASTNYTIGNISDTVTIADDGDLPAVSVSPRGIGSYELLPGRPAKFNVSVLLPVLNDLTVNLGFSGTAVPGVDFVDPSPLSVVIPAGQTSKVITVTPIDNSVIATDKTLVLTVQPGNDYVVGTSPNATNILRNDDLPAATTLFADNFDVDSSASWSVRMTKADNDAIFAYDYSQVGVPAAPHSSGVTKALRLRAHTSTAATATGLSVSPVGKSFTGDYRLRFDLWMNYNGPLDVGGSGSSQYFTTGMGVSEVKTNVTAVTGGSPGSSVIFSMDNDGGFAEGTGDFIVYTNNAAIAASGTSIYPAGARDNFNAYYAEFGELTAPADQLNVSAAQTAVSPIGSLGFAWHDVVCTKQGTNFTWEIDGLRIANLSYATALVGNNISLGFQDINTSKNGDVTMEFVLVDNLRVESLAVQTPVITSVAIVNSGANVQIDFTGDAADAPAAFILQSAANVAGPYSDVAATVTSLDAGKFRAVQAVSGSQQFYRIKR